MMLYSKREINFLIYDSITSTLQLQSKLLDMDKRRLPSVIEVMITKEELDQLNNDLKLIKESNCLLQEENNQLNDLLTRLTRNIQEQQEDVEKSEELKDKVRTLSKRVLQLSRIVLETVEARDLKTQVEVLTDQDSGSLHSSNNFQSESIIKAMEGRQVLQNSLREVEAEVKTYKFLLEQKESAIKSLTQSKCKTFQTPILDSRFIKKWKMTESHIEQIPDLVYFFTKREEFRTKARVERVEAELKEVNYLLLNSQNIVETFRAQLAEKDKMLKMIEESYRKKEMDVEKNMSLKYERRYEQKKEQLQKQYAHKIQSLKDYSQSMQTSARLQGQNRQLQLQKFQLSQQNISKQSVIDYMNKILSDMRGPNDLTLERAIDLEIVDFQAKVLMLKEEQKKAQLQNKLLELNRRVKTKLGLIELQYEKEQ